MLTLGVYNGAGETAAVIVDAGTVVSAVHAAGPVEHTALPRCAEQALALAGVQLADVDAVYSTGLEASALAHKLVNPAVADAVQLRAITSDNRVAVVMHDGDGGSASIVDLTATPAASEIAGARLLLQKMQSVAHALGLESRDPIAALESIAMGDSCTPPPTTVERHGEKFSVRMDTSTVDGLLNDLATRCASPADVAASPHVDIQRIRAQAATAVLEGLADVFACVAERASRASSGSAAGVALAGTVCASSEFIARMRRHVDAVVVPVPERFGAALGAALLPHGDVRPLAHLALGASFSEDEIKGVLESCRLDYVYEPDWSRLYVRVSELLETGALIGWYQGRADFSRQSFGSRSILCDPSRRYSRENVNVFLLHRHAHAPLAVSLGSSAPASGALSMPVGFTAAPLAREDAGQALGPAIKHDGLRCYVADPRAMPEFHALLHTHRERTQVPGLLNVPMLTGGVLAPTPRDAVREIYASAADALVIGRFVVAKDYWLLRSRLPALSAN